MPLFFRAEGEIYSSNGLVAESKALIARGSEFTVCFGKILSSL